MPAGPVRFAVAGHAECDSACADLALQAIGPDRSLAAALRSVAAMRAAAAARAPCSTPATGSKAGLDAADAARYASLLGSTPACRCSRRWAPTTSRAGAAPAAFESAFAGFPAPFGVGRAARRGSRPPGIPGAAPGPGARTHYAFDSSGPGGTVRVIVIDNSLGSLAASDPHQNPPEAQLPWLEAVLADARGKGIPTVVMGSRSLNTSFTPKLNVATDGDEVAQPWSTGGASAYLFDRPEENRAMQIPAGAAETIPSYGTGTLGYRSPIAGAVGLETADALFGDSGLLLLELDAAQRDPATNRAPVGVRLIPLIEDLSLEATDGTLLRRSRPALFRGLGRRPRGGDRWGQASAGSGVPNPSGGDPYTLFPPAQCLVAGCAARIPPEYTLHLLGPRHRRLRQAGPRLDQPAQALPRRRRQGRHRQHLRPALPLQRRHDDGHRQPPAAIPTPNRCGCSRGRVQRPCGTRPLRPDRFERGTPSTAPPAPPPPPGAPPSSPPVQFEPPPLSPPSPTPAAVPNPPPTPAPAPVNPFVPLATGFAIGALPAIVPPPPPPVVRPLPPGGAPARTYQVEEKREEEAAIEESQAFSRHEEGGAGLAVPPYLPVLVLILALAGASVRGGPGARRRNRPAPATTAVLRQRSRR